jgi:hypothetical protein
MPYIPNSIDSIVFFAGFIPSLFSLLTAAFSTDYFISSFFIKPATRLIAILHRGHKDDRIDCDNCLKPLKENFSLSLSRFGMSGYLSFLSVGFLSQSLIFLTRGQFLPGFSFIIYFLALTVFNLYYVIAHKEIFSWWDIPLLKCTLMIAIICGSAFAAVNPQMVSILDILFNNNIKTFDLNLIGLSFQMIYLRVAFAIVIAGYVVARVVTHFVYPSLRNKLKSLIEKSNQGTTINEWYRRVNNEVHQGKETWTRKEVQSQIRKFVYQEIVDPERPNGDHRYYSASTIYGKSR